MEFINLNEAIEYAQKNNQNVQRQDNKWITVDKTVIPKEKLKEICPDNDSEISIDKINEETANKIIEIAEEFGKNVATYLDTIKTYSDRIFFISTTIQ